MRQESVGILVAQPFGFAGFADTGKESFLELEYLLNHRRWDGVYVVASADQQRLGYGQRQRDVQAESRALAGHGVHFDATAEFADFGLDDVHANTAASDLVDLGGSRETGGENQLDQPTFIRSLISTKQAGFDATGTDALEIETRTIVGHGNDDFVAFLRKRQ